MAGDRIAGESTPEYAWLNMEEIGHIHRLMPNVKIIYLLRNPIDRAWSAAMMMFALRKKSVSSLSREDFISFFCSREQLGHGAYLKNLKRWENVFDSSHIFIGFLEEIRDAPEAFFRRVLHFLGVDDRIELDHALLSKRVFPGPGTALPRELKTFLSGMYEQQLCALHERFGGYANAWYQEARRELEGLHQSTNTLIPSCVLNDTN